MRFIMRPKGSKDKKKRKSKVLLNSMDERMVILDYSNGMSSKDIREKYSITKSCLSQLLRRRQVPKRVDHSIIKTWERIDDIQSLNENISGIYGIYFLWKYDQNDSEAFSKVNNIKLYIGSSVNIKQRLSEHYRKLNNKIADNKNLQNYFDNNEYEIKFAIIKRCDPKDIMQEEGVFQREYNKSCLINSWLATKEEDLLPWLEKAIQLQAYKNYKVTDNECWECNTVHKSGYSRIKVVAFKDWGPGIKKYFYSHRVAYWEKYGEYAELIRHKCGNSKCRNPDHLIKGNYRDNALDKRGDFPIEFENKWLEFEADLVLLSNYYGGKWLKNMNLGNTRISRQIYEWEKKLNLREKYPDVIKNNKNRRFNALKG